MDTCASQSIYVGQVNNPLSINSNVVNNVSCYGGSNGIITVDANGGSLPYQYYINGNLNTNPHPYDKAFTNLSPILYYVYC